MSQMYSHSYPGTHYCINLIYPSRTDVINTAVDSVLCTLSSAIVKVRVPSPCLPPINQIYCSPPICQQWVLLVNRGKWGEDCLRKKREREERKSWSITAPRLSTVPPGSIHHPLMKRPGMLLCPLLTRLSFVQEGLSIFNNKGPLYAVLKVPRPIYSNSFFPLLLLLLQMSSPSFPLKVCKQESPLELFREGLTPVGGRRASPSFPFTSQG